MYFLKMPDTSIVGSSPEMLVKIHDRELEYRPIAGTLPRGKDEAEDDANAEKLSADEKQIFVDQIFFDNVRVAAHRTARRNHRCPGFAKVVGPVNKRPHVAKRVDLEGGVDHPRRGHAGVDRRRNRHEEGSVREESRAIQRP